MIIFNINCKQFDRHSYRCNKKEKRFFIFRPVCVEIDHEDCEIAERHVKGPPPGRPPRKP